jgi:hypothetical protein
VELLEHDGKQVTTVIHTSGAPIDARDMDIILAVGPWTIEVLGSSGIEFPPKDRIPTPTGLFAFQLRLDDDQVQYFKKKPVFSHIGPRFVCPPKHPSPTNRFSRVSPTNTGGRQRQDYLGRAVYNITYSWRLWQRPCSPSSGKCAGMGTQDAPTAHRCQSDSDTLLLVR